MLNVLLIPAIREIIVVLSLVVEMSLIYAILKIKGGIMRERCNTCI